MDPPNRWHHALMRPIWFFHALQLCVLLSACAALSQDGNEEGALTPNKFRSKSRSCFATPIRSSPSPTVCNGPGGPFVTHLPLGHHWTRDTRVVISKPTPIAGEIPVAVAWVVQNYEHAVTINVLVAKPGESLEGARAQAAQPDEHIRFGKFYARMEARNTDGTIILDVGDADGVRQGDTYEARNVSRLDYPVGQVRVTRVHSSHADAEILTEAGQIGTEHAFVFSSHPAHPHHAASAVEVGIFPVDSPQATSADQTFMPERTDAGRSAMHAFGIEFRQLFPSEARDPNTPLHDIIAASARAQHVSRVVWAAGPCPAGQCVNAWYADIPDAPNIALEPRILTFPSLTGGSAQNHTSALLGQIAHAAKVFDAASYHLRAWATDETNTITTEALLQLAEAEQELKQFDRARIWLRPLEGGHVEAQQLLRYLRARVRGACADANPRELEALQRRHRKNVAKQPQLRQFTLDILVCEVGLSLSAGNKDEARALIEEGMTLAAELNDRDSIRRLNDWKIELDEAAGRFDDGLLSLVEAYKAAEAAGDRHAQARNLLAQATNRARAGDPDRAKQNAERALALFKVLQDDHGIAECMPILVPLSRQMDGIEAIRDLITRERRALKRRDFPRATFALALAEAYLDLQEGELGRAGKSLQRLRDDATKRERIDDEIQVLEMQAELFKTTGQTQQANKTIDHLRRLAADFDRPGTLGRADLIAAQSRLQEGDWTSARDLTATATEQSRKLGDRAGIARAELILGEVEREFGEVEDARQHYQAAKTAFSDMQDPDGAQRADLGLATLALWRERSGQARQLAVIESYFKKHGNRQDLLRTRLQLVWAKYVHTRVRTTALRSLKSLRDEVKRRKFVALQAEAQMLIGCVHRIDGDHRGAEKEFVSASKLYAAIGRIKQGVPCDTGTVAQYAQGPVSAQ